VGSHRPPFYLGTDIDGVFLNAEQLFVRSENLNDLLGRVTYTDALFHILTGSLPSDEQRELFDIVLVAFHGGFGLLPPTTLVPRLVAGTGVSTAQALAAGYLASGPYHVGAVEQAMSLYSQILETFHKQFGETPRTAGELEQFAHQWVAEIIDRGETIPGYGHPLLRKDPRPTRIRRILCDKETESAYLDVYDGVVRCASEKKGVAPNVDGITGAILLTLGFRPEHGTGLFLLARTAAMLAHVIEEQTDMPYQTQKRFMILPVALPRLFNANFKRLAKFFNRLRDNKSYQTLQTIITGNAKSSFVEREKDDQSLINESKRRRIDKQINEELNQFAQPQSEPRDQFATIAKPESSSSSDQDNPPKDDALNVTPHCSPELLAGAAFLLSTSLGQLKSVTNDSDAGESTPQSRAEELLRSALKLVEEAAVLKPDGINDGQCEPP